MAQDKNVGIYTLTKPALLSHPNLFTAKAIGPKGKESGTPKFSANIVLDADHPDFKPLQELAATIAKARWPGRPFKDESDPTRNLKFPFVSGTKLADKRKAVGKEDGEFQRGKIVIPARSKYEPKLSALEGGKVVEYEGDARKLHASKFFFGAECLVQLNLVAYEGIGSNPDGVTAYLNMIFVTGKGKKLGGGTTAAEAFKGYVGTVSNEDPTGGDLDDNIDF